MGKIIYFLGKAGVEIMMKGSLSGAAGSNGLAYPTDPDQLGKISASWVSDIDTFAPWTPISEISHITGSRCWVAAGEEQKNEQMIVTGSCSSSMDMAWHFISKKMLREWGSILAVSQLRGRGQLGRRWFSPEGNIYSAIRFPSSHGEWDNLLPLIVGYSLIRSFAQINCTMKLKWPNDLVIDNKKVGGILIEKRGSLVVVGVGLNLISSPGVEELRNLNVIPATSFKESGYDFTPLKLWQKLTGMCRDLFQETIETKNPCQFIAELHGHLAFMGRKVKITDFEDRVYIATIIGLSENGGLKLLFNNEIKVIQSGSLCPLTE